MSVRSANFQDILQTHYVDRAAFAVADSLASIRNKSIPEYEFESFPLGQHISQSSAILFSPAIKLLRFYSLLEIALIGKFIPEPDYMDQFWKDTLENLSQLLATSPPDPDNYPMVLPQFLLGRLMGKMHLEEEGIDVRYDELASILVSFFSIACRWWDPEIGMFLRFALSRGTADSSLNSFIALVADRNEFMRRIVVAGSPPPEFADRLLCGLTATLDLCEDLDRLLEATKPFPLLQSAMWTYHADLFSARNNRLRNYLMAVVGAFTHWVDEQPEPDAAAIEIHAERARAIYSYVEGVRKILDRLSSGEYGIHHRPNVVVPPVPVGVS